MAAGRWASDAELRRALAKSLKAFGVRLTKEDLRAEGAPPVIASGAKQSRLDRHGSGEPRDDDA